MRTLVYQGGSQPPAFPGCTPREIARGTGLSLSSVYRALHELEARKVVVRSWPFKFPAPKPERRPQA